MRKNMQKRRVENIPAFRMHQAFLIWLTLHSCTLILPAFLCIGALTFVYQESIEPPPWPRHPTLPIF